MLLIAAGGEGMVIHQYSVQMNQFRDSVNQEEKLLFNSIRLNNELLKRLSDQHIVAPNINPAVLL